MKKSQLQELIRIITQQVVNEYTGMPSSMDKSQQPDNSLITDPSTPPRDAMTSAEKSKLDRDREHQKQQQIKQKQVELDAKRKEMEFNKKKLDQQKRFDVPLINKDLQRLKGAKI